jgi:hypothetical protein
MSASFRLSLVEISSTPHHIFSINTSSIDTSREIFYYCSAKREAVSVLRGAENLYNLICRLSPFGMLSLNVRFRDLHRSQIANYKKWGFAGDISTAVRLIPICLIFTQSARWRCYFRLRKILNPSMSVTYSKPASRSALAILVVYLLLFPSRAVSEGFFEYVNEFFSLLHAFLPECLISDVEA